MRCCFRVGQGYNINLQHDHIDERNSGRYWCARDMPAQVPVNPLDNLPNGDRLAEHPNDSDGYADGRCRDIKDCGK